MYRTLIVFALASLLITATACSNTTNGSPSSQPAGFSSPPHATPGHSTDASRTNGRNNGTTYEPCDQMARHISLLGLDLSSQRDAATMANDFVRGCVWSDHPRRGTWSMDQIVTNWPSLEAFRLSQMSSTWLPPHSIAGREVVVLKDPGLGCSTYVQSSQAGVITTVTNAGGMKAVDECAKAIEATTAVIDQIPR